MLKGYLKSREGSKKLTRYRLLLRALSPVGALSQAYTSNFPDDTD